MKAAEDIVIIKNEEGIIVPYKSGASTKELTFKTIKKGKEIPSDVLVRMVARNIEKVADIVYKDKIPTNLPKELYSKPTPEKMIIKKRKYTQESLTEIYNTGKFSALKKVGDEFGVTDRSSSRLIVEILRAQEERQRAGK